MNLGACQILPWTLPHPTLIADCGFPHLSKHLAHLILYSILISLDASLWVPLYLAWGLSGGNATAFLTQLRAFYLNDFLQFHFGFRADFSSFIFLNNSWMDMTSASLRSVGEFVSPYSQLWSFTESVRWQENSYSLAYYRSQCPQWCHLLIMKDSNSNELEYGLI